MKRNISPLIFSEIRRQCKCTPNGNGNNQMLLEVQEPFLEKVPGRRRHFTISAGVCGDG